MSTDPLPDEPAGGRTDGDPMLGRVKAVAQSITRRVKDVLKDTDFDAEVLPTHDTKEQPPLPGK